MKGEKLLDYLVKNNVRFEIIHHPLAYSSTKTAQVAHVHGKEMAKPVIVKDRQEAGHGGHDGEPESQHLVAESPVPDR